MSNKLKTFKPKKIKFKKNEQPTVAMPDMYTLNKQMMAKEPLLTPEQFEDIKAALHSSLEMGDYGLLCRERYDFTVFRIVYSRVDAVDEIIDVITSRGPVISIDKQEDNTWEIWIKSGEDDAVMYKFFPCEWIIDC